MKKIVLIITLLVLSFSLFSVQPVKADPSIFHEGAYSCAMHILKEHWNNNTWFILGRRGGTGTTVLYIMNPSQQYSQGYVAQTPSRLALLLNTQSGNQLIPAPLNVDYYYTWNVTNNAFRRYDLPEDTFADDECYSNEYLAIPATSGRAFANTTSIYNQLVSSNPLYYASNTSTTTTFSSSFGLDCGTSCAVGDTVMYNEWTWETPIAPPSYYNYYLEYPRTPLLGYLRLESKEPCHLDISANPTAISQPLVCNSDFVLYQIVDGEKNIYSTSSIEQLMTPDAPDYCTALYKSNYNLLDEEGNPLCKAIINPLIDQLAPPFTGLINFDPDDYDWGTFNFLKEPAKLLFDAIDSVVVWFYGLWRNFLEIIIPNPESLSWTVMNIRKTLNEKFSQIDLTSFEAFQNLDAETLEDIQVQVFGGITVTLLSFSLIEEHLVILRPVAIASVGLFLIIFNINQVNKLLADKEVTS